MIQMKAVFKSASNAPNKLTDYYFHPHKREHNIK